MPRRSAKVLLETPTDIRHRRDQILEGKGIWSVFLDGFPVNIRNSDPLISQTNIKYKKSSFSNSGPAIALARKLNAAFKCQRFTVYKMTPSEQIFP